MPGDRKRSRKEKPEGELGGLSAGFGGLFKGFGQLFELVSDLMESGEGELTRTGELKGLGTKGARAVYGITVRTLAGGEPVVESFGNIRRTPRGPVVEEVREPLADVFEEEGEIQVIAEVPGVEEEDVRLRVEGDILHLTAERGERKYAKEILLPAAADPATLRRSIKNGVLEIRMGKKAP